MRCLLIGVVIVCCVVLLFVAIRAFSLLTMAFSLGWSRVKMCWIDM